MAWPSENGTSLPVLGNKKKSSEKSSVFQHVTVMILLNWLMRFNWVVGSQTDPVRSGSWLCSPCLEAVSNAARTANRFTEFLGNVWSVKAPSFKVCTCGCFGPADSAARPLLSSGKSFCWSGPDDSVQDIEMKRSTKTIIKPWHFYV